MAVNPKSEDGLALRKLFPLATMPAQQFKELCAGYDVTSIAQEGMLFNWGDITESFIYLVHGTVSLEADQFMLETINAGSDAAKFALAHQFPRQVSARALDNVRFISLGLNVFDKNDIDYNELANVYRVESEDTSAVDASTDWLAALLQSPVFQRLPAVNLQQVLMALEDVKFSKGEVIFKQGDVGDYCYLIKKGHCSLSRKASEETKEISYLELVEGETFGEQAILTEARRNMTVTAVTDMLASRIDAERFNKFIKKPALEYIDYDDLQQECEQSPELLILDIRSATDYHKNHIEGSRNIPFFSLRMFSKELVNQAKIFIVCADGKDSDAAAFELIKHRVNAVVLKGGMQSLLNDEIEKIDEDEIEPVSRDELSEQPHKRDEVADTVASLQQENQLLKADNARLMTELDVFKKQYRLLFKKTQKLKAAFEKLQAVK